MEVCTRCGSIFFPTDLLDPQREVCDDCAPPARPAAMPPTGPTRSIPRERHDLAPGPRTPRHDEEHARSYIIGLDSLDGNCEDSIALVRAYITQLARDRGCTNEIITERMRCLTASVAQQSGALIDCGFFATGNIARLSQTPMPALLESLRRAAPSGRLNRHQCNTLFRSFTQADATSTRRRLREHLRGRLRQSLQTPPTTDWAPTVAPGRWAGATPRPRACENPNRILATVRAPAPPSDDRRQLLDRTVYNGMPLCEQELARLYSHQNPVDSYLNDTLIDWNLAELLRGGEIPETSLVFGGRLMAMLHNSLPRGNTLNARGEDTRAVYNRMKRWLNGMGGARNVDPLARDMLFFLDNQAAGHWRLVVCVNPAALIAGQDDDAGVRAPAPPTPPGGVALEGPSADAHALAPPPHLDAGARDSQGGDDSTHVPPQPPTATQSRWRPSQRRKCERCGQRMPAGHGQCRCYEWLDSDDSQAGG